jgi:hypothetical protein
MSLLKDQELQKIVRSLEKAEQSDDIPAQIKLYIKLTKLLPMHAVAHARAAALLHSQGDEIKALHHIHQAMALPASEEVDALIFPLLALHTATLLQDLQLTHSWFQEHPNYWRLQLLLLAMIKQEHFAEAQQLANKALEHPDYASHSSGLLLLLAHIYYCLRCFHESSACCQLVLESAPDNRDALYSLGNSYNKLAQYDRAIDYYQRALESNPDDFDVHHSLAHLMLKLGNFKQGWAHSEWRWAKSIANQAQSFNIPEWHGEPLEGKRLLVWSEQGVGDQIMFASTLPDLLARTSEIAWEGDSRLLPLFKRSLPAVKFIEKSVSTTGKPVLKIWPSSDFHIPAGSLGKILRDDISKFPRQASFLKADNEQTRAIRRAYQERFPGKLLVGLSWRGGTTVGTNKYARSLRCEEMQPLTKLNNVQFVNLQYGDSLEDRDNLNALGLDIYHDTEVDPLLSLDNQAAQLCALDLVLSVDNTTVHLAGALGVKTYLLLPTDPDWRWGLERTDSYWYPSLTLIRSTDPSSWIKAVEAAVEVLNQCKPYDK